jgi:hypothetical protein
MREREDLSLIVERCLQALAAGATIEQVLAMYPQQGDELRQALLIAEDLRMSGLWTRAPAHAQAASKAQFLAHAEQLRKPKGLAAAWHWLTMPRPGLGSLVFGVGILTLILLAISSTQALPGDGLYPVKLAAEQASLSIIDDPTARLQGEENLDQKRLVEVQKILVQNRENLVSFAGILKKDSNGKWLANEIPLNIDENLLATANSLTGVYVEISGHTEQDGQVHVQTLSPRLFEIEGVLNEIKSSGWMVGKLFVQRTPETSLTGELLVGSRVSVEIARIANSNDVLAFSLTVLAPPSATATSTQRQPIQGPLPSQTPDQNDGEDDQPQVTDTPAPQPTNGSDHEDDHHDDEHDGDHQTPLPGVTATRKPKS